MTRKIPDKVKNKAIQLRRSGKSYNEIKKELNIASKGTLSFWFENIKLSEQAKRRLKHNIELSRKRGLFAFNKQRTKSICIENKRIRLSALKKIPSLSPNLLFLVGIALYWGEGFQSERNKKAQYVSFVNTNPYMIALYLRFIREILKISDNKIKAHIRLYPTIQRNNTIKFWQKVTKLPYDRFRITTQISGASRCRRSINSTPYGTIDIRINSRKLFFEIKGYIDGLALQSDFK